MTDGNELPLRLALVLGAASGGTAAHVAALADGCRRAGAEVSVLGPERMGADLAPGITFTPIQIGSRPNPARDTGAILGLRRRLRSAPADVVHAHGVRAGAFAAMALAPPGRGLVPHARVRAGLVLTVHNGPPQGEPSRAIYAALERICARRCDVVLCASDDLAARMRELGAADVERYDVPAMPAEPPSAAAVARAAADIGAGGRPVVLGVGRLAPQKGFDVLVAAAGRWRDQPSAPLTVIAGDGPLAARLTVQARESGADVLLLGERDDVPALLAVADIFVLPSRWEARALALQEAMRAGRAIVATTSGGTPELTGAQAAVLVPPEDDAALAEAIMAVLADGSLAATLGLAARARAASFPTQDDAVARAMAIYRRLAGSSRMAPPPT
jgi:glycosyltransferase involved in cell wall biosynthesis